MRRKLAVAVVSHPPDEPAAGDASLVQLLLSLAANLIVDGQTSVLFMPSCPAVAQRVQPLLTARAQQLDALPMTTVVFDDALLKISPEVQVATIDNLPATIKSIMIAASQAKAAASAPGWEKPWDKSLSVSDVGRYSALYRSLQEAVAVRYAMMEMEAHSVLVLKPESYLWKPARLSELVPARRDVWFADQ